jgi:hypothetical protein
MHMGIHKARADQSPAIVVSSGGRMVSLQGCCLANGNDAALIHQHGTIADVTRSLRPRVKRVGGETKDLSQKQIGHVALRRDTLRSISCRAGKGIRRFALFC